jgi:hypothetical protein
VADLAEIIITTVIMEARRRADLVKVMALQSTPTLVQSKSIAQKITHTDFFIIDK